MYQQFTYFSICLLFYAGIVQGHPPNQRGHGTTPNQRMKENLDEWTANVRKSLKELEGQIERAPNNEDEFVKLQPKLKNFYQLISRKTNIRVRDEENGDQNEQKWILLAQEYSIKFRDSQMKYYCNRNIKHDPKENLKKITELIRGFPAEMNTFLAKIELLMMEEELEQSAEKVGKLANAEEWAKIVKNLEKLMKNTKIDHQMIGKLKMEYEENKLYAEYRKNVEEMMGKMEVEIGKMRKEIAKNRDEIYLTEHPFKEAERRIIEMKNDKSQLQMSNLRRIVEVLILESKMDILRNEFEGNFKKIILKNEDGTPNYDWIAFLASGETFLVGYDQIEARIGKLSSENDQKSIRTKLNGIKKMAQKAVPIKELLIEKLRGLSADARADIDKICTDMFGKIHAEYSDQIDQMKRFYTGAIELCDKLDEIYDEIGILRSDILPEEIRDELDEEMDELLEYKISIGHAYWSARNNFAEIRAMVEALEEMKNRVEKTFYMI